ncbi:potassium channel family protein [Bacillus massiliglaciei]|uniref:potassium channel family protein n=1 Tax=Bacillus massiliglaciei TaxID=1816693 RepID=UPI000DA5F98E|nr:potassium channel family protein [Bacillus massiliglaciei]
MFSNGIVLLILIIIAINLYAFFYNKAYKKVFFRSPLFYHLFLNFVVIAFGFAVIYYLFSQHTVILMVDSPTGEEVDPSFWDLLYFSGVTLLAIGYGDYVPVGNIRFFALIEGSIGMLLPAAYFIKALNKEENPTTDKKEKEEEEENDENKEENKHADRESKGDT